MRALLIVAAVYFWLAAAEHLPGLLPVWVGALEAILFFAVILVALWHVLRRLGNG